MKVEVSFDEVNAVLNLYKMNTKIDETTGALQFGNLPVIWARADILANLYTELESLVGQSVASVMKRIGKAYGLKFFEMLKTGNTALFMDDREKLYRYICSETQAIGWGRIVIEDNGDELTITSPGLAAGRCQTMKGEVREYPIDAYLLGYFEGFFSAMKGQRFIGEEVECVSMGFDQCKMVFKVEG
jgi:predicted hydrocarbon binding protein